MNKRRTDNPPDQQPGSFVLLVLVSIIVWALLIMWAVEAKAATGYLVRQTTHGMTRTCIYNAVGNEYAVTIRKVQICPMNMEFPDDRWK